MPKTGGSSFKHALEQYYTGKLSEDYADFPINTPALNRNWHAASKCLTNAFLQPVNTQCIHGHFLPLKYWLFSLKHSVRFITWMRDPVERLASHYFYWQQVYNPQRHKSKALHRRMMEECWSLERFCLGAEMKNFYSQFLWGFPLSRFKFIGITEYYDLEFKFFTKHFLGLSLPVAKKNMNSSKKGDLYINDPALRSAIERHHAKDMQLYNRALALRLSRIA